MAGASSATRSSQLFSEGEDMSATGGALTGAAVAGGVLTVAATGAVLVGVAAGGVAVRAVLAEVLELSAVRLVAAGGVELLDEPVLDGVSTVRPVLLGALEADEPDPLLTDAVRPWRASSWARLSASVAAASSSVGAV